MEYGWWGLLPEKTIGQANILGAVDNQHGWDRAYPLELQHHIRSSSLSGYITMKSYTAG